MSAWLAATASWVTMTIVWPNRSTADRMNVRISPPVRLSRLPVGSSAKISCGLDARARATATRCCWPPESSLGRCFRRSPRPTRLDDGADPLLVRLGAGERHRQGDVLAGVERRQQVERLEHEADALAAHAVSSRSESDPSSMSPRKTRPDVSESSPARQCISVLLPDPDGPMTAVKRPAGSADGHVVEGEDLGAPAAVHLGGALGAGGEGDGGGPGRDGLGAAADGGSKVRTAIEFMGSTVRTRVAGHDGAARCLRPWGCPYP